MTSVLALAAPVFVLTLAFGAALLFGAAAWSGALVADVLCRERAPYDDGPVPVAFGRLPFAALGACVGVACALHGAATAQLTAPGTPPAQIAPLFAQIALMLAVTFALAGCAAADLACGALPDVLTLGPLALVLALGAAAHDAAPALGAALVALPFAAAAAFSRGRGMGWGDVKLAALGGALLGFADATLAFMLAALAASAVARRTAGLRRPLAFGPYLAASIAAMLPLVRTF